MKIRNIFTILFFITGIMQFTFAQTPDEDARQHNEQITAFRNLKNVQFGMQDQSPLTAAQLENFEGLNYFPVDYNYRVEGAFKALETPKTEELATTSGSKIVLNKIGKVTFKLQGKTYTLDVFQNTNLPEFGDGKQLFIPFTDATSSLETTSRGRYLPVTLPARGEAMMVDFNQAINPFFAYADAFSSIIPPQTNAMGMSVHSGERKFEDRR